MTNDETMQRLRKQIRETVEDEILTHTGRSVGDIASGKVADALLQALAAEIERAEVAGMEKAKNIIADKMKRDIKALEPYLKDLQSKTGGDNGK